MKCCAKLAGFYYHEKEKCEPQSVPRQNKKKSLILDKKVSRQDAATQRKGKKAQML